MRKFKNTKGFTLLEVTVAMALVGLLMLAVFKLVAFISDTLKRNAAEDKLQSTCINLIEETRYILVETHSLQCGSFSRQGAIGDLDYVLAYSISEERYPGAYKMLINARTSQTSLFTQEVILYAS